MLLLQFENVLMFELYYAVFIFFFSGCCFFEFVVFNEEILLTLCFLFFLFFVFTTVGNSIFENLKERALKIENELFFSFIQNRQTILFNFYKNYITTTLRTKFLIMEKLCLEYLHVFTLWYQTDILKFFTSNTKNELVKFLRLEQKLRVNNNRVSIQNFLYPLFFLHWSKSVKLESLKKISKRATQIYLSTSRKTLITKYTLLKSTNLF